VIQRYLAGKVCANGVRADLQCQGPVATRLAGPGWENPTKGPPCANLAVATSRIRSSSQVWSLLLHGLSRPNANGSRRLAINGDPLAQRSRAGPVRMATQAEVVGMLVGNNGDGLSWSVSAPSLGAAAGAPRLWHQRRPIGW